jgi:signal transduction histidine kinase
MQDLSIGKTIRYIEWIAIFTSAITILSETSLFDRQLNPPILFPDWLVLVLLLSLTPLSLIFPVNRPLWQIRAYILLELTLILLTRFSDFEFEVNLYLIHAKACFLLKRKDVIIIVSLVGIIWSLIPAWLLTFPELIEYINSQITSPIDPKSLILENLIQRLGSYFAASIFVILLSFVIVAERRSREKAIALTQEIDFLAAAIERSRIARDIHDSLGHTLTTLNIQLELAQRLFDRNRDRAKHSLDNAKNLSKRSLEDMRRSFQTMHLEDFNLNQAITSLVTQSEQNRNLEFQLEVNLPKLPWQTSYQLYCILQEGLTNIQKHAQATLVSIRGQSISEEIILEIEDNGRGFNPNRVHSGYGLLGMKERVHSLGGSLKINSACDQGTCIEVKIPL